MGGLYDDLRFGLRLILNNPAAAIAIIIVLALGIGANTAIFTIVDCVLIRPLPYSNPEQLTMLWETEPEITKAPVTGPDYEDWKTTSRSFQSIAGGTEALFNLTGSGEPLRLEGFSVAPNMFDLFGVGAACGRTFQADDNQAGRERVVVLTNGLWKRAFGGDPAVIGQEIILDAKNYTVIGVLPANFRFPDLWTIQPQFFVPLVIGEQPWQKMRGSHWMFVFGRLKSGVTVAQADAELRSIAGNLEKAYPDSNAQIGARVVSLREQITGRTRSRWLMLLVAVGLVLAIACANVANLTMARAARRDREMAVRLALGATRFRILRQLLTETILLSMLGAMLALLLALGLERVLLKMGPPGYVPSVTEVHLNYDVFLFAAALAICTGFASGLMPAWQSSHTQINETLKEAGRSAASTRSGFRNILVVAEVASALVLLFGAGATIRSLRQVLRLDAGFNPQHVLTMKFALPERHYPDDAHVTRFTSSVLDRIRGMAGIESAGASSELPFQGGNNGPVLIEGQPAETGGFGGPLVENAKATPGYFQTMQIPIVAGRDFSDADASRDVAVINQAMVRKFWPNENPIGKRFSRDRDRPKWIEVIGVVADTREFGLEVPAIPQAFVIERPSDANAYMNLVVRTALPPDTMARQVVGAVHEVDKQVPVFNVAPLEELVAMQTGTRRFNVVLLGLFAGLALLLAAVGIYGVMSYLVTQRTSEIGVRMALGASPSDVIRLVLGHSARLLVVGVLFGILATLASGKLLASILFQVKPNDPAIITTITLLLGVVAQLASYIPARRAARVDPMVALRHE